MSAIDEFGSDVNTILADLEAQFKKLNAAKQDLKTRGGEVAGRWAQHFAVQAKAINDAEIALNRISNAPLTSVSPAVSNSGPLSSIPKVS